MKRIITLLAVTAVGATLFAAGCGGDDETTTSTTASTTAGATGDSGAALTEDAFVEQANAICAEGNQATNAAADEIFTGGEPTGAQLDQYAEIAIPSIQAQLDAIRALTPPEDTAGDVTSFLDDAETALDEVEADPAVLTSGDPFADVNTQAKALGLDECGSDS